MKGNSMNTWRSIKTVLWSFIGLGGRRNRSEGKPVGNPLILIPIAFVLVVLFLGTLAVLARVAVSVA
jgi:hypothetical protein